MVTFLRENWLFIVVPIAVVLVLLTLLVAFGDDTRSSFLYTIF